MAVNRLSAFFKDKHIFITGCTGSVGMMLVEKLLRSFPEIGTLICLIRSNGDCGIAERTARYFDDPLFSKMKEANKNYSHQIVWMEGNIEKPNLGLTSENMRHIYEYVNIIYHSAATVRFHEPLRDAIRTNVFGTNEVYSIAANCKNIYCFMHISTAYCNHRISQSKIHEIQYKQECSPFELIAKHHELTTDELVIKYKSILKDWPNTYTFTKCSAENLLCTKTDNIKIGIFRIGCVTETYEEPFPGWLINANGLTVALKKSHTGITYKLNSEVSSNANPIDYSINALIAATYDTANIKHTVKFYNMTTNNPKIPQLYKMYMENVKDPWLIFGTAKYRLLCHVKDFVLEMSGKKGIFVKEMERLENLISKTQYFVSKKIIYHSENVDSLWESLTEAEKSLVPFNLKTLNWNKYIKNMYELNRHVMFDMNDFKPVIFHLSKL